MHTRGATLAQAERFGRRDRTGDGSAGLILGSLIPLRPGRRDRDYASIFPRLDRIVGVHYLRTPAPGAFPMFTCVPAESISEGGVRGCLCHRPEIQTLTRRIDAQLSRRGFVAGAGAS